MPTFKVIGLTRLGTKPESTASEADALTTRPSELSIRSKNYIKDFPCECGCLQLSPLWIGHDISLAQLENH